MWFCARSTNFCRKKCCFYEYMSKKCRIYALMSKNEFWTWSQMGPKYQFGPKKVQILLTSPKFFRFPQFFSTFPGFLGFSQFFSVVFRFSKVLHKSSLLYRGTNMTLNSGLEKVPILLTSPKFLSFPRFFSGFLSFSRLFSISVHGFLRLCINGRDYTLLEAFFSFLLGTPSWEKIIYFFQNLYNLGGDGVKPVFKKVWATFDLFCGSPKNRPKNNRKLPKNARKTTKTCPHFYKKRMGGS